MDRHYTEAGGAVYLAQRLSSASGHVQELRASMFIDVAGADLRMVDFGCGNGGVLSRLPAAHRSGIEVGDAAANLAREAGLEVVGTPDALPASSFDVAISFHAIEHVDNPLDSLRAIGRLVVPDGHIRLIVPCEMPLARVHRRWSANEDRHLHTWTPLLFGNLADRAGYREIRTKLVPMPSGSRLARLMAPVPRMAHWIRTVRSIVENRMNVVLDARPPSNN